jgi:hypothetical protein
MEITKLTIYNVLAQALNIKTVSIKLNDYLIDRYNGDDEFSSINAWAIEKELQKYFNFNDGDIFNISKRLEEVNVQDIISFLKKCPLRNEVKAHVV